MRTPYDEGRYGSYSRPPDNYSSLDKIEWGYGRQDKLNYERDEARRKEDSEQSAGAGVGGLGILIFLLFPLLIVIGILRWILLFFERILSLVILFPFYTLLVVFIIFLLYKAGGYITSKLIGVQYPRLKIVGAVVFVFAMFALSAWGYWEAYGRKAEAAKWARLNKLQMEQDSTEARQKREVQQARQYKVWENW